MNNNLSISNEGDAMKKGTDTRRSQLARLHGHGEKAESVVRAVAMVVGGAVAFIGGLRELVDAISPLPPESDED